MRYVESANELLDNVMEEYVKKFGKKERDQDEADEQNQQPKTDKI